MVIGESGFQPSTVTPKTICDLGVSSICILGSAEKSFESRSSNRPSSGLEERAAEKRTVIVWAGAMAVNISPAHSRMRDRKKRISEYRLSGVSMRAKNAEEPGCH